MQADQITIPTGSGTRHRYTHRHTQTHAHTHTHMHAYLSAVMQHLLCCWCVKLHLAFAGRCELPVGRCGYVCVWVCVEGGGVSCPRQEHAAAVDALFFSSPDEIPSVFLWDRYEIEEEEMGGGEGGAGSVRLPR